MEFFNQSSSCKSVVATEFESKEKASQIFFELQNLNKHQFFGKFNFKVDKKRVFMESDRLAVKVVFVGNTGRLKV